MKKKGVIHGPRPRCLECNHYVRRLYIQTQVNKKRELKAWGWVCTICQKRSTSDSAFTQSRLG